MASSPGYAVVGIGAVGFGFLMVYGGYKNVPIWGKDGILSQAITTGKLVTPTPKKQNFSVDGIGFAFGKNQTGGSLTEDPMYHSAISAASNIAVSQPTLATHLQAEIDASQQEGAATGTLISLIKMADSVGFHDDAATLQSYADQVGRAPSGVM